MIYINKALQKITYQKKGTYDKKTGVHIPVFFIHMSYIMIYLIIAWNKIHVLLLFYHTIYKNIFVHCKGSTGILLIRISQCKWYPVAKPVLPIVPSGFP